MQPVSSRTLDYPIGPDGYSNMNPSNENEMDIFAKIDPEVLEELGLKTDEELDEISLKELKNAYKILRAKNLNKTAELKEKDKKIESINSQANIALAHATSAMAVQNLASVRQNVADVRTLNLSNVRDVIIKVISAVGAIVGIVLAVAVMIL